MRNRTEFEGTLLISPPLRKKQARDANSVMNTLFEKGGLSLQNSDASVISFHEAQDSFGGFNVSKDGWEIIFNADERLYERKRTLKYLIEHGIKPQGSIVNGEMVFLDEYGCFGIIGVDNNEVYIKQYLRGILLNEFLKLSQGGETLECGIKSVPKTIDDTRFIPTIYRYDVTRKITRITNFEGSFEVVSVKNMKFYLRSKETKDSYMAKFIHQQLERPLFKNLDKEKLEREIKYIKRSLLSGEEFPIIAEHNSDGTIGDISETSEWVLSSDNKKLFWSGKSFIAVHCWLAYLVHNAIDCSGSVKWTNEFNEQGNLIVESFENMEGFPRNVVYIEYKGTKYLANISWSY